MKYWLKFGWFHFFAPNGGAQLDSFLQCISGLICNLCGSEEPREAKTIWKCSLPSSITFTLFCNDYIYIHSFSLSDT